LRVGESLVLPAESGSWRALSGPDSGVGAIAGGNAVTPTAPGVYEFRYGAERKLFSVNLSPEESDPAAWSDGKPWEDLNSNAPVGTKVVPQATMASRDAEQRAPLWWWLVVAMAAVMLAELGLANRTTR
jgi:hypothetical protein